MTGIGAWADAYNKAVEFVRQLTIEEKVFHRLSDLASRANSALGEPRIGNFHIHG